MSKQKNKKIGKYGKEFLETIFYDLEKDESIKIPIDDKTNHECYCINYSLNELVQAKFPYENTEVYFDLNTDKGYRYCLHFRFSLAEYADITNKQLTELIQNDNDTNAEILYNYKRGLVDYIFSQLRGCGLFCHIITFNGTDYDVYALIVKTNDLEKVIEVENAIFRYTGAGCNTTNGEDRIAMVPTTNNWELGFPVVSKKFMDNTVELSFRRHSIDTLYKKYVLKETKTHNTNEANIHNRNNYNDSNKPKLDYQVMAESEDYVEGRGVNSGVEF